MGARIDPKQENPEYDPSEPVNRGYEVRLHDFHGRPYYW